jgi:FtsH-binding integral membrane protein
MISPHGMPLKHILTFLQYDVQKILAHARMAEQGLIPKDPVNESISLELDFINIFVRMVQILGMNQNRRK